MRTLASRILCSSALLVAVVPAFASERRAAGPRADLRAGLRADLRADRGAASRRADLIPAHFIPTGSGFGAGTWHLPATGSGAASAELYDASGRLRYVVRASLVRSGEFPPAGMPEQGGFYGELLAVVGPGLREPIAQVEGTWIQESSSAGAFAASILIPSEDLDHPLVAIGLLEGTMRAPMAVSQLKQVRRGESHEATTLGRLSLTWTVGAGD